MQSFGEGNGIEVSSIALAAFHLAQHGVAGAMDSSAQKATRVVMVRNCFTFVDWELTELTAISMLRKTCLTPGL